MPFPTSLRDLVPWTSALQPRGRILDLTPQPRAEALSQSHPRASFLNASGLSPCRGFVLALPFQCCRRDRRRGEASPTQTSL